MLEKKEFGLGGLWSSPTGQQLRIKHKMRRDSGATSHLPLSVFWTFTDAVAKLGTDIRVVKEDGSIGVAERGLVQPPSWSKTEERTPWDEVAEIRKWCQSDVRASLPPPVPSKKKRRSGTKAAKGSTKSQQQKKSFAAVAASGPATKGAEKSFAAVAASGPATKGTEKAAPPAPCSGQCPHQHQQKRRRAWVGVCKFWQRGLQCRYEKSRRGCQFQHRFADGVCTAGSRLKCTRDICPFVHTDDNALLCQSWMRTGSCPKRRYSPDEGLQCTMAHQVPQRRPQQHAASAPPPSAAEEDDASWNTSSRRGRGGYRGRGRGRAGMRY